SSTVTPMWSNGTETFTFVTPAAAQPAQGTTFDDSVVLNLAEDAYQGDAQFIASMDGHQLSAATSVTALHSQGGTQAFNLSDALSVGTHDLTVSFVNDQWGGSASLDRNLYVNGVTVGGTTLSSVVTPIYSDGSATFAFSVDSSGGIHALSH
ncbi:MAG: hypothetical protein JO326_10550, partial [Acetobacteraceae bacterium]|nr:hypothetical protein [Acetobacteraceae bacterium]